MSVLESFIEFLFPKKISAHTPPLPELTRISLGGTSAYFLLPYKDPSVRTLIHAFKYDRDKKAAQYFAKIIFQTLLEFRKEDMLVTFIPPRKERIKTIGYDQGSLLIQELKKLDKQKYFEYKNILFRVKEVKAQTSTKSRKERIHTMQNVFGMREEADNRMVVVLDDVCTTGATFKEATRALEGAKPKEIICLGIAH